MRYFWLLDQEAQKYMNVSTTQGREIWEITHPNTILGRAIYTFGLTTSKFQIHRPSSPGQRKKVQGKGVLKS